MLVSYKNFKIELEENLEKVKDEIDELEKLYQLLSNSSDFKLLEGKTQFIGKNKIDSIRSRKEHTDRIRAISKRFIKMMYETVVDDELKEQEIYQLNLRKELLYSEIIAISHDLGHTPFGHLGERILNKCVQQSPLTKEDLQKILLRRKEIFGEIYEMNQGHNDKFEGSLSFEHNEQSAKTLFDMVQQSKIDTKKLNFPRIIQAILAHSTSRVREEDIPNDLVTQIIRQADKIEYTNNDFAEVETLISKDAIYDKQLLEFTQIPIKDRIKQIIQELLEETLEKGHIDDHMSTLQKELELKELYQNILFTMDTDGKRGLLTGENIERITIMVNKIYEYYLQHPEKIPYKIFYSNTPIVETIPSKKMILQEYTNLHTLTTQERLINYLCKCDDQKIENIYVNLVKERGIKGKGHGIEPIKKEDIEKLKKSYYSQAVMMYKYKEEMKGIEHSQEECEQTLKSDIQKIIEENLTKKGRQRMEEVRICHELEIEKDEERNQFIKQCDENPSYVLELQKKKSDSIFKKLKKEWEEETK